MPGAEPDPASAAPRPPSAAGKSWVVFAVVVVMAGLIAGAWMMRDRFTSRPAPTAPGPGQVAPADMRLPDLAALPQPPGHAEFAALAPAVRELLADPESVHLKVQPQTPLGWAWLRAQLAVDAGDRPFFQGFASEDLIGGAVRVGSPVLVGGGVVEVRSDTIPAEGDAPAETWLRLTVQLDGRPWFVQVVAPASAAGEDPDALRAGRRVQMVGRTLGLADLPVRGGGTQKTPVIGVLSFSLRDQEPGQAVVNLLGLADGGDFSKVRQLDEATVFGDINDDRPVLEKRPYYWLLGRVNQEANWQDVPYPDARDGLAFCDELHLRPHQYRGQAFTVDGIVWDAFEDLTVAGDKPFGVSRVVRIRLWKRISGVAHKVIIDGREHIDTSAWVHAFEFAVIDRTGTMPLPEPGQMVRATGRFLKVHGYPAPKATPLRRQLQSDRAIELQSNNVYFKMFVVPSYSVIVPPPEPGIWRPTNLIFIGVLFSLVLCIGLLIWRERRRAELARPRRLPRRAGAPARPAEPAAGPASAEPPAAPPSPPPQA